LRQRDPDFDSVGRIGQFRLFHGWWRYTDLKDVVELLKAILLDPAFLVVMRFVLGAPAFPPPSIS